MLAKNALSLLLQRSQNFHGHEMTLTSSGAADKIIGCACPNVCGSLGKTLGELNAHNCGEGALVMNARGRISENNHHVESIKQATYKQS